MVKVRLYRPFSRKHLLEALPATVKKIGGTGPHQGTWRHWRTAVHRRGHGAGWSRGPRANRTLTREPRVVGGRYGLSSKEFTPAMIKAVFDELSKADPKNSFTVGIIDDVTHTSLDYRPGVRHRAGGCGASSFLGSWARTVQWAPTRTPSRSSAKGTDNYAQGHFVYDSKKSGALTVSHLRFGPNPIRSTYLIRKANFVAVHQFGFFQQYDVLGPAVDGATLLINAPYPADEVWDHLPRAAQQQIIDKKLKVYTIDAYDVAGELGLGTRINTIMQTCFFAISGVLPQDEAIEKIKEAIQKTYGKRGEKVVRMNFAAVDAAVSHMHKIEVPAKRRAQSRCRPRFRRRRRSS